MRATRIAAASDLHGYLPPVPPCDLLLLAGDLCPAKGGHRVPDQLAWLNGPFRRWLDAVPAARVIGVAGNHDFIFQDAPHLVPPDLRWTYLQDSGTTAGYLNVWGSPWQPVFGGWAFNADLADRRARWGLIPGDTHVLVLHGPPHGVGDLAPARRVHFCDDTRWQPAEHTGCRALAKRLTELPELRLAVFGHIHAGRGVYPHEKTGQTRANVAVVDESYQPAGPVTLFDLPDVAARRWWVGHDPAWAKGAAHGTD